MADQDEYGFPDERTDDYASMLADLEQQADARTLRLALGVDDEELALIRVGHVPGERTAERLRLLHEASRETDLSDPGAVLAALTGDEASAGGRSPTAVLAAFGAGRHAKLAIVAFVVVDVLVAVGIVAVFFLRGL